MRAEVGLEKAQSLPSKVHGRRGAYGHTPDPHLAQGQELASSYPGWLF